MPTRAVVHIILYTKTYVRAVHKNVFIEHIQHTRAHVVNFTSSLYFISSCKRRRVRVRVRLCVFQYYLHYSYLINTPDSIPRRWRGGSAVDNLRRPRPAATVPVAQRAHVAPFKNTPQLLLLRTLYIYYILMYYYSA